MFKVDLCIKVVALIKITTVLWAVRNTFQWLQNTVVISINAITSMHKSTLNTNNFGNNLFGQKYQEQNILRISGDYNGVCLKNFQRIEQKLENAFLAKLSILLRIL